MGFSNWIIIDSSSKSVFSSSSIARNSLLNDKFINENIIFEECSFITIIIVRAFLISF
jgi:hypothetical protein